MLSVFMCWMGKIKSKRLLLLGFYITIFFHISQYIFGIFFHNDKLYVYDSHGDQLYYTGLSAHGKDVIAESEELRYANIFRVARTLKNHLISRLTTKYYMICLIGYIHYPLILHRNRPF